MTNIFKGLDLIECLKHYRWRFITLYRIQWPKPSKEKEMQEGKVVVGEVLTNSWEKKRSQRQKKKRKGITHLNTEFQRIARRDKKAFLSDQCKEIEENNRERLEISSRKVEILSEEVHGVAKSRTWLSDFAFTFHFHALEKEMATHSSILAWRIPGMGEPGGLSSMGLHRVGHDWCDLAAAAARKYFVQRWAQ